MDKTLISKTTTITELFHLIGNFGRYQWMLSMVLFYTSFFSVELIWTIFTLYTPQFQCIEYSHQHINTSNSYESCYWKSGSNETVLKTHDNHCLKWNFETTMVGRSVVEEYSWICEKSFMRDLTTTVSLIGYICGAFFGGYVSDWFGRRKAWIIFITFKISGNILSTAFSNEYAYLIGRFINCIGVVEIYTLTLLLCTEYVGAQYRSFIGIGAGCAYSFGFMAVPLFAYISDNWKTLHWIYSGLIMILPFFLFILKESPSWLINNGRREEFKNVIKSVAKINKSALDDDDDLFENNVIIQEDVMVSKGFIFDLFKSSQMRIRTLVVSVMWFSCSLLFFAISLNAQNLVGNIFVNTFLLGLVEIPANFLCMWIFNLKKFGRKYGHMLFYIVSGVSCFAVIPFLLKAPESYWITIFSLIGKGSATAAFNGVYLYTAELYPTEIRTIALGTFNTISRLSGLLATAIGGIFLQIWSPMPYAIFGVMSFLTSALILLLPETLNKPLPQSMSDILMPKTINLQNLDSKV